MPDACQQSLDVRGRQYHQWFGHGTAPKEDAGPARPGGLFDPASVGQRINYAVGSVIGAASRSERSRWESRLGGTARESLKTVVVAWYDAHGMSRDTFQGRLLDPYTSDETVDRLRQAAKGIVEARTHEQLGAAGGALASAVFRVGLDAWPRFLSDSQRRAIEAVSANAIPGAIKASATGTDTAVAGGALLLGGLLYLVTRQRDTPSPSRSTPDRPIAPAPTTLETAVPVPPPVEGEKPTDVLKPGGQNVGEHGENPGVRVLPGGDKEARKLFDRLTKGGTDITPSGHPGKVIRMSDGSVVSHRPTSKSGPPTIDVNVPGLKIRRLKFPEEKG